MTVEKCPWHDDLVSDVKCIKKIQRERPCQVHTTEIGHLVEASRGQWKEINKLKIVVYTAAPITGLLAFIGSLLGQYLK